MGNDAVPYSTTVHANAATAVPDANDDGRQQQQGSSVLIFEIQR